MLTVDRFVGATLAGKHGSRNGGPDSTKTFHLLESPVFSAGPDVVPECIGNGLLSACCGSGRGCGKFQKLAQMEITAGVHSFSEMPSLVSGVTPKYVAALHLFDKDVLLLPSSITPSMLRPDESAQLTQMQSYEDPVPHLLSYGEDAQTTFTIDPSVIFTTLSYVTSKEHPKSLLNMHPATVDSLVTRMLNTCMSVDLLVFLPPDVASVISAPTKKAPQTKGAPQAPDHEYTVVPLTSACVDLSGSITKALNGDCEQLIYPVSMDIPLGNLGALSPLFAPDAQGSTDLKAEILLSVSVKLSPAIANVSTDCVIGRLNLASINVPLAFSLPGYHWRADVALPVEPLANGEGASSAVYASLYGGQPFGALPSQRNKSAPQQAASTAKAASKAGQGSDITIDQVNGTLESIIGAVMPQLEYSQTGRSRGAGLLSTGLLKTSSTRPGYVPSQNGAMSTDSRLHGGVYDLNTSLRKGLCVRAAAMQDDQDTSLCFPDYYYDWEISSLGELAAVTEARLTAYLTALQACFNKAYAVDMVNKGIAPGRTSQATSLLRAETFDADLAPDLLLSQLDQAAGMTALGVSLRFSAELFDAFALSSRRLVRSRNVLVCFSAATRGLMRKGYLLPNTKVQYTASVVLQPAPCLGQRASAATALLRTGAVAKPPTASCAPLASQFSLFTGNAQSLAQFSTVSYFGTTRSALFLTQQPDAPFNRLPMLLPALQTNPAFNVPENFTCFAQLNAADILLPTRQETAADCIRPIVPYDRMILHPFVPPVILTAGAIASDITGTTYIIGAPSDSERAPSAGSRGGEPTTEESGPERPVQLRGKASRGDRGARTQAVPAAAQQERKGSTTEDPVLHAIMSSAGRYPDGSVNYMLTNVLCGAYSILLSIGNNSQAIPNIPCVRLASRTMAQILGTYSRGIQSLPVVLRFFDSLHHLLYYPSVFNGSLATKLVVPSFAFLFSFPKPLMSAALPCTPSGGSSSASSAPTSTRGSTRGSSRGSMASAHHKEDSGAMELVSPRRRQQFATINSEIKACLQQWRSLVIARYTQEFGKPTSAAEAPASSQACVSTEESEKMRRIVAMSKTMSLRGISGQVIAQNALLTPTILPKISAHVIANKVDAGKRFSFDEFILTLQSEGFLEVLTRRAFPLLKKMAAIGYPSPGAMFLRMMTVMDSLDFLADVALNPCDEQVIARLSTEDLSGPATPIARTATTAMVAEAEVGTEATVVPPKTKQASVRYGPDVLRSAASEQSLASENALGRASQLTSAETLALARDIRSCIKKAGVHLITSSVGQVETGFALCTASLAKVEQLQTHLPSDTPAGVAIIERLSHVVSPGLVRGFLSSLIICGLKLASPHAIETSDDMTRLMRYIRAPSEVLFGILDSENEALTAAVPVDAAMLVLCTSRTLFRGSPPDAGPQKAKDGRGSLQAVLESSVRAQCGSNHAEDLLARMLADCPQYCAYMIRKAAFELEDKEHSWRPVDQRDAIAKRLNRFSYNHQDLLCMFDCLQLPAVANDTAGQTNSYVSIMSSQELSSRASGSAAHATEESIGPIQDASSQGSHDGHGAKRISSELGGLGGPSGPLRPSDSGGPSGSESVAADNDTLLLLGSHDGFAGASPASPVLQNDAVPFNRPPFWVLGSFLFVAWNMRLASARTIHRSVESAMSSVLRSHYEHANSSASSGSSPENEREASGDEQAATAATAADTPERVGTLNDAGASDTPVLAAKTQGAASKTLLTPTSYLSILSNKKANRGAVVSSSVSYYHRVAVEAHLRCMAPNYSSFIRGLDAFGTDKEYLEYVLDSSVPRCTKLSSVPDGGTKHILRLCALISLAEWLSVRGETTVATFTIGLCESILRVILTLSPASKEASFFVHQQLRMHIANMRILLSMKKYAAILELSESISKGVFGASLVARAKGCPAFLHLRALCLLRVNYAYLAAKQQEMQCGERTPGKGDAASRAKSIDRTNTGTFVAPAAIMAAVQEDTGVSIGAVLTEGGRLAAQAFQLAMRNRHNHDDFLRGSLSLCETGLCDPTFLYMNALAMLSGLSIMNLIRNAIAPRAAGSLASCSYAPLNRSTDSVGLATEASHAQKLQQHRPQMQLMMSEVGTIKPYTETDETATIASIGEYDPAYDSAATSTHGEAHSVSSLISGARSMLATLPTNYAKDGSAGGSAVDSEKPGPSLPPSQRPSLTKANMMATFASEASAEMGSASFVGMEPDAEVDDDGPTDGKLTLKEFRLRKNAAMTLVADMDADGADDKIVTPSLSPTEEAKALPAVYIPDRLPRPGSLTAKDALATFSVADSLANDAGLEMETTFNAMATISATIRDKKQLVHGQDRQQREARRLLSLALTSLKHLLDRLPQFGPGWATLSVVQLAMGNLGDAKLSCSLGTLLSPEAPEPWVAWVCCELFELYQQISCGAPASRERCVSIRAYLKQVDGMGVRDAMIKFFWLDVLSFASDILV